MTRLLSILLISLFVIAKTHADDDSDEESSCVRLTSAFNYDGYVYLVSGNEYFLIDSDFHETEHGTLEDEFYAPAGEIDAAVSTDEDLYFFQGFDYYSYNYLYYFGTTGAAEEASELGDFFHFGLDAAATLGDTTYYFHGCEYAKGNGDYEMGTLDQFDIPCHVDAAWSQGDKMYIVLENDVWTMDENEDVTGPERLSNLVTLTTTSVCPNNPFYAKIRAEQSYERKHECTIIDAAINYDGIVYLFNDYDYITLDDAGNEIEIADIFGWGGLPGNIDAGIVWSGDDDTYFFQGDHYYKYFYGFLHNIASGPRKNSHWGPFFEQGIDAAGNYNGKSYFFKGCEMVQYKDEENEVDQVINSPDIQLPCDVDAAFSREGTLYVIKRNQVWTWREDEEVADSPVLLSTAVNMTSWTACPPEED